MENLCICALSAGSQPSTKVGSRVTAASDNLRKAEKLFAFTIEENITRGNAKITPARLMRTWLFASPKMEEDHVKRMVEVFVSRNCVAGEVLCTQGISSGGPVIDTDGTNLNTAYMVVCGELAITYRSGSASMAASLKEEQTLQKDRRDQLRKLRRERISKLEEFTTLRAEMWPK
ncbi:hypothetical protein CYMTET_31201 [Cymbomonas tetramitiformis]|uniref:Uncharacterized protein n=1 Tax=Cymbomonas tetramitiformis TaxID=36881 RepID=A0AAE0KT39_9CHLO|nr:hypothetical protein CYMTET_31201 [Cymbomonas tetramitiformis]